MKNAETFLDTARHFISAFFILPSAFAFL